MAAEDSVRRYRRSESAVFFKTKEEHGGLSNMAGGFPLTVAGHAVPSAEALYQACRFPQLPEVQSLILRQKSPMTSKMVSKPHRSATRTDWDAVRVRIMRWCLRVKLASHWDVMTRLLLATGNRPIVEESRKDDFWGAKATADGELVGRNVLGRLLMELRELVRTRMADDLKCVAPPEIPNFVLLGVPIGTADYREGRPLGAVDKKPSIWLRTDLAGDSSVGHSLLGGRQVNKSHDDVSASSPTRNDRRLIEAAFPLRQASLDSVHEKSQRHGHISTLHIWPARRPLAACRASLIATLLPDPGTPEGRKELCERIGGRLVKVAKRKRLPGGQVEEKVVDETVGGILHWKRETANREEMEAIRKEIRAAFGGRSPRVLDPFAGGGAIPLEAMRLGCEVTASDLNPVAWFLLKCTLEYPHRLAGRHWRLPDFAIRDREFMEEFFKAQGYGRTQVRSFLRDIGHGGGGTGTLPGVGGPVEPGLLEADLAWQVRAWGRWVLASASRAIVDVYPVVNGKPTVAYLWARTVECKNCRATLPLLKTRWLAKKGDKRVLLIVEPNRDRTGVEFSIQSGVPKSGGNNAQRREHDRRIGLGTMSRAGAWCPCCGKPGTVAMEMEDLRAEGMAHRFGEVMTCVVVEGDRKEYRIPTPAEVRAAEVSSETLSDLFKEIPLGSPDEPLPAKEALGIRVPLYGFEKWSSLFTNRQRLALGSLIRASLHAREKMAQLGVDGDAREAIAAYLAAGIGKLADYSATLCTWHLSGEKMSHVFVRFALPITWDFAEVNPLSDSSGNYQACMDWVAKVVESGTAIRSGGPTPQAIQRSVLAPGLVPGSLDLVVTDPPYYGAIPYSDLMDFFYVWLRRAVHGLSPEFDRAFASPLCPKWDEEAHDGELIDDSSRHGGDEERSKKAYENGMAQAFATCHRALTPGGRLVIVFANKDPDAWETLVSAIIRAGFVVDGSWPIQTEMGNRTRAQNAAALASSVWLVCKKRPSDSRPGWDTKVLAEMKDNVHRQLREFWDAGIRGPDFVWAATGPAMEVYSRHPLVKKADAPGKTMEVAEFLRAVRRLVVDFAVGRILGDGNGGGDADMGLDDATTYYLLHRNSFGMEDAPAGGCILYALSCGLDVRDLEDRHDLLAATGSRSSNEDDDPEDADADAEAKPEEGTGSTFRLKTWKQRARQGMGFDPLVEASRRKAAKEVERAPLLADQLVADAVPVVSTRQVPFIDQVHRLMHLWKAGDVVRVDAYIDDRGLRKSRVFSHLMQGLVEMASEGTEERAVLEAIMKHLASLGMPIDQRNLPLRMDEDESEDTRIKGGAGSENRP